MMWIHSLICPRELWSDGLFHLCSEHVSASLCSWLRGFLDPTGVWVSGILSTPPPTPRRMDPAVRALWRKMCVSASWALTIFCLPSGLCPRWTASKLRQHFPSSSLRSAIPEFFLKLVNLFQLEVMTSPYCGGFCHTSPWISHGWPCVPHPEPPPISLPTPSLWVVPEHRLWVPCLRHQTCPGHLFHIW